MAACMLDESGTLAKTVWYVAEMPHDWLVEGLFDEKEVGRVFYRFRPYWEVLGLLGEVHHELANSAEEALLIWFRASGNSEFLGTRRTGTRR